MMAVVINFFIDLIPVNSVNIAVVSDSYPKLFTPPGYVFAIWGVTYVIAIVFMVYQVRPPKTGGLPPKDRVALPI